MDWHAFTGNEKLMDTIIGVGIFLLFLLARKLFTKYLYKIVLRLLKKSPSSLLTDIWRAFEGPIRVMFVVFGIFIGSWYMPYFNVNAPAYDKIFRALIIFLFTWGFYNLSGSLSKLFKRMNDQYNFQIDQILIPFLTKAVRLVIMAISLSIIVQLFGYDISGFIAGLGLGGLAFALAAQDMLKNLFGGIVILFEKPFSIGDWILTPSVEGTVEDITFRSTKVRTSAQALVTVPNSTLANEPITNWSKMGKRKVDFRIGIDLETPTEKIGRAMEVIRAYLRNQPDLYADTVIVNVEGIDDNRLELLFNFFTRTTVWSEYLMVKERILLEILNILDSEGIQLAVPVTGIIVRKQPENRPSEGD
jgi:Mechanosensitive ion channel.